MLAAHGRVVFDQLLLDHSGALLQPETDAGRPWPGGFRSAPARPLWGTIAARNRCWPPMAGWFSISSCSTTLGHYCSQKQMLAAHGRLVFDQLLLDHSGALLQPETDAGRPWPAGFRSAPARPLWGTI